MDSDYNEIIGKGLVIAQKEMISFIIKYTKSQQPPAEQVA
jgi:hypothetical protein